MILPDLPSYRRIRKTISLLVAISFIFSSLAFAETPKTSTSDTKKETQEITTDPEKIVIPRDYGLVKAKYTGRDPRKLIIHIQDAHCNYEAQSNIIKILECLIKNDSLSLISVEGADGFIDTSWFKAFPDADIRKEVADYFMKKGEITGPEFLSITSDYPIKLFGAETRSYYIENLNAFTSSYPLKEDTEKYFNQIKAILNKLKSYIYSDELKELDIKSQDYESKKLSFTDYVKYLESLGQKHKVNLRQYENFFKLVSVLIYEKKINFNVVDKERAALIDVITKKLEKDALTELVNKSLEFKTGKISSAEYYDYLKALAVKHGISMPNEYPNLFNYIIYNSVYSKIENEQLFNDIKKFEEAVKDKIFTNDDQKTLDKLSRHINILLGLVNIRLLNGDFDYYKSHTDEFAHEIFAEFIKKMAVRYGFAYEVDAPSPAVTESMPKLEDFYSIAIKRDKALVDNTIQAMRKEGTQISVLVTGGFHSEGITKLLEKQGISYIVVCPNITKDVETPYIKILTNQRTPLEEILADTGATTADAKNVKSGMLAPHPLTAALDAELIGGLVKIGNDAGRKTWTDMVLKLWLPKDEANFKPTHISYTSEIAQARFKIAVDKAVDDYYLKSGKGLDLEEKKQLIKNANEIKKSAAEIIKGIVEKQPDTSVREKTSGASLTDENIDASIRDPHTEKIVIFEDGRVPDLVKQNPRYAKYAGIPGILKNILTNLDDDIFTRILNEAQIKSDPAMNAKLAKVFTKENLLNTLRPESGFKIVLVQPQAGVEGTVVPGILMWRTGSNYGHYSTKNNVIYGGRGLIDTLLSDGSAGSLKKIAAYLAHELAEYVVLKMVFPGKTVLEALKGAESKAHFAAQFLEIEIAGRSARDEATIYGPRSSLDDVLEGITREYFQNKNRLLVDKTAEEFLLAESDKLYLYQMWSQYLLRSQGLGEKPLIIAKKSIKDVETGNYNPKTDGNFILDSMLDDNEVICHLGALPYSQLAQDPKNDEAAKNTMIIASSLDGGIGEAVGRLRFLQEMARKFGKNPKDVKQTAKGTDLGYIIKSHGKDIFICIAEAKLMQLVLMGRENKFSKISFQALVNWQSKKSYEDLLNAVCALDRLDDSKKSKRTYRQLMEESGIEILEMLEQADLPAIEEMAGDISINPITPRQPGGHGQFGFLFLLNTYKIAAPNDGKGHVRVFYNGDNVNSRINEHIAGAMVRHGWPIVKLTTTTTPIDKKTGQNGVRIVEAGGKFVYVSDQMEAQDAKNAEQQKEFEGAGQGHPGGIGRVGKQTMNTNIIYINEGELHSILKELVEEKIVTEYQFYEIISPLLIDKPAKEGKDGNNYIPLDGAIGTAMHRLNKFFVTSTDPRVKQILADRGIDRLLYFVQVPRTEFFTPVKNCFDAWMQDYSDYYNKLSSDSFRLKESRPDLIPPDIDIEGLGNLKHKNQYWNELQNVINSLFNASTVSLKLRNRTGVGVLKYAFFLGDVSIINDSGRAVDLRNRVECAGFFGEGKFILSNVSIVINRNGAIKISPINNSNNKASAIRANGGGVTAQEHGTRGARDVDVWDEKSINGAIASLIGEVGDTEEMRHWSRNAYTISGVAEKLPDDTKILDVNSYSFEYDGLEFNDTLNDIQLVNYQKLVDQLNSYKQAVIVIRGLKKKLAELGVAQDLIFHPGITRKAVYLDEEDFLYLLSLKNGVELMIEAIEHEQAHIDHPDWSEKEIEKIAPSVRVRKAILDRAIRNIEIDMNKLDMEVILTNAVNVGTDAYNAIISMPKEKLTGYFEQFVAEGLKNIPEDLFGKGFAYDVRGNAQPISGGIVDLTPLNVYIVGKLLGTYYAKEGDKALVTGDIRNHTPILRYMLALGAASVGVNVEYAPDFLTTGAHNLLSTENEGNYKFMVQVSGSHGVSQKNGLKMKAYLGKKDEEGRMILEPLYAGKLEDLYWKNRADKVRQTELRKPGNIGGLKEITGLANAYVETLDSNLPPIQKDEIVVVDPRAGAAGPSIMNLLLKRGFAVIDMDDIRNDKQEALSRIKTLWSDPRRKSGNFRAAILINVKPDGNMGRGIWDPSKAEALKDTQEMVTLINKSSSADMPKAVGFVFDGDADRLTAIREDGVGVPAFEMTLPYYQRFLLNESNQSVMINLAKAGFGSIKMVCDVRANSKLLSLLNKVNKELQDKSGIKDRNIIEGYFITTGYPPQLGFMNNRIAELDKFVNSKPELKKDADFMGQFAGLKRTYFTAEASGHNFFHISRRYPNRVCDCALAGLMTLLHIKETATERELKNPAEGELLTNLFANFPPAYSSEEIRVSIPNAIKIDTARKVGAWMKEKYGALLKPYSEPAREDDYLIQSKDDGYVTVSGFKIQLKDGRTALVRWSNTGEELTTIFEGPNWAGLISIVKEITERLRQETGKGVNVANLDKEIERLEGLTAKVAKDLQIYAGLPISLDAGGELRLGSDIASEPRWSRPLKDAGNSVANPAVIRENPDREVYYGYRNARLARDTETVDRQNLRFDITVLKPGLIGEEFIMTKGHIHEARPESGEYTHPEFYEVWNGAALYVQQGVNLATGKFEFFVTLALPGDKVLLIPGYSHRTVNIGNEPLVMANWISDEVNGKEAIPGVRDVVPAKVKANFKEIETKNGYTYWVVRTPEGGVGFKHNPNYGPKPAQMRFATPALKINELGLSKSEPMYSQVNNKILAQFLKNPEADNLTKLYDIAYSFLSRSEFMEKVQKVDSAKSTEFSEAEEAFADSGWKAQVQAVLSKANITGEYAEDVRNSIMNEAIGLFTTLNMVTATNESKKIIVLGRDTGLDPEANAAAQAGKAAVEKYLGDSLIEVRGKGKSLLEGMQAQIAQLKAEGKVEGKDFVVITIAGNTTLDQINKNDRKDLGKIINILDAIKAGSGKNYLPIIGLYDLAIRIAYNQDTDNILSCLNRIASNENGRPFIKDDIEKLLAEGLIRILPKIGPVNMTEAIEAYKAAEQVLRAL